MSSPEILYTSLGLVVLDKICLPGRAPLNDVLGGSGVYATLGARLFLPCAQSRTVGWRIHIGKDFPVSIVDVLKQWDTTLIIDRESDQSSTRGLLEYKDTTFGKKTFKYTTSILSVQVEQLKDSPLLASKSFHFLEGPQELKSRVSMLHSLRREAGIAETPLIIWEPGPLFCKAENLNACLEAASMVDVFSPNHLELLSLFEECPTSEIDNTKIEELTRQFLDAGIGPERSGTAIIRAGERGCMIWRSGDSPKWLPPFYQKTSRTKPEPEIVDPTGAGNAFLGAYAIGYLRTGDPVQAASYGAVGASFALEQISVPQSNLNEAGERWNGTTVLSRLQEYKSRLGIVLDEQIVTLKTARSF